jgi:REP element-mobilizing transposase RayT
MRLAGNESGSVDKEHHVPGTEFLPPNPRRVEANIEQMRFPAFELSLAQADSVLKAICEVCAYRGWTLLAAHVRSNHVHLVVAAKASSGKVMGDVKAYASRLMNRQESRPRPRWTRHGSTRYLWKSEQVYAAIQYVVHEQGDPMAVWQHPDGLTPLGCP